MNPARALFVATVAKSLLLQSPAMLDSLQSRGTQLTLAAAKDSWAGRQLPGVEWRDLGLSRSPSLREIALARRQLEALLLENRWDLVQVQSPIAAAVLRSIPAVSRMPSIYVAHGFHFHADGRLSSNLAYGAIEAVLAGRTAALAVVSAEDFHAARRLGFGSRTLVWRLPGAGVDLKQFSPPTTTGPDVPTVLFCGDLNDNKDPLLAIAAVQRARARYNLEIALEVIGSGQLAPAVARQAQELPWLSWQEHVLPSEMPARMRRASALLAPSRREGLPRVVLEAVACGVPVVARSNRGTREILSPLTDRWLLLGNDVDEWAAALMQALRVRRLSDSDIASVRSYDTRSFMSSYLALVDRVIGGGGGKGYRDLADQG